MAKASVPYLVACTRSLTGEPYGLPSGVSSRAVTGNTPAEGACNRTESWIW